MGGEKYEVMFKQNDDMRQDILTLQMILIMDRIWLNKDLDLAMTPYKVIGTGCEQGLMEFVAPTVTLADIQHNFHTSLLNTFSNDSIELFF